MEKIQIELLEIIITEIKNSVGHYTPIGTAEI